MGNETAVVIYEDMEVLFIDYEPYMTIAQIASLLGVSIQAVGQIINGAAKRGEYNLEKGLKERFIPSANQKVNHYDLNAILLVGFRSRPKDSVDSLQRATAFREWVADIVRNHLINELKAREAALEKSEQDRRYAEGKFYKLLDSVERNPRTAHRNDMGDEIEGEQGNA